MKNNIHTDTIAKVDEHQRDAFKAWINSDICVTEHNTNQPNLNAFKNTYSGEWENVEEFATNIAEERGLFDGAQEELVQYFDWDAWTNDILPEYTIIDAPNGNIYAFYN